MDSNKNDLITQYKTLQDAVNQSSLYADKQLNTINNNYIGGFILLLIALGIAYFLNIFEYWIPAGFLLFYFLLFGGLLFLKSPFIHKDIKDTLKPYKQKQKGMQSKFISSEKRNLSTLMQSFTVLYFISFFILISIEYSWIDVKQSLNIFLPALTCLLFLPVPLLIEEFSEFLHPSEIKTSFQKIFRKNKNSPWKIIFHKGFLKSFFLGSYLVLLLILPFFSVGFIYNIIAEWPYLLLLLLLQLVIIILFAASFSANMVQKEFTSTINTYADINYILSMAQIQKEYSTTEYKRLLTLYQSAKPYDYSILNIFKFINYYVIIPNRIHLKKSLKHPRENFKEIKSSTIQKHKKKKSSDPSVQKENFHQNSPFTKPVAKSQSKKTSSKTDKQHENQKIGNVGILVYGPMLDQITPEIKSAMKKRIKKIKTPFNVELARKYDSYGGAPGLVPVKTGGAPVNAELFVLKNTITERIALDMLYRMENHLEGTKKRYKKPTHPKSNDFVIKTLHNFHGINKVFYSSIGRNINKITAKKLAKLFINSVYDTNENDPDGLSYLINLKKHDITTPMTIACEEEILHQTYSHNLGESRDKIEKVNAIKSSI